MKKLLAFMLVACMSISLCGCNIVLDFSGPNTENDAEVTLPSRPYETPEKNDAIVEYLSARYEGPFQHVSYDHDQGVLYYKSEKYSNLIKVYDKEALWLDGYDISLYEGDYADNGYYAVSYHEAYQYYWSFVEYIPNTVMLMEYSGDVLPSAITPDMKFTDVKQQYPEYFKPTIYLLRTDTLEERQLKSLELLLEGAGEEVSVYIVVADKERWEDVDLETIKKYPKVYLVRQYFSTIKDSGE